MAFSFGKTPSTGSTPSLFGNTGSSAPGAQTGSQPGQSGFSFGGSGSGGLFGAKPAESKPAGSLFGQPAQSGQQNSLFGQNTSSGQTGQQQGGLFGQNTSQSAQGGNLFGQQQQQQQPSGGLFGQSSSQSNQTGQQSSLFGQPTGQNTTSGQQPSLFGQSNTQNTSSGQQTSLFGAPGGQAAQPAQQSSLFGQSQSQPSGLNTQPSLFGQSTTQSKPGLFGQSTSAPAQPANTATGAPDAKLGAPLNTQLEQIRASWDTSNLATCQFQHYLYNRASDPQALQQLTVRRPDAVGPMHDALWAKAMQENPEPDRLYPVLAVGFGDLRSRVQAQESEAARQHNKLAELSKQLSALQQKHDLSNTIRTQSAMLMQSRIHQRLLALVKDGATLIPALRNQSLTASEDQLLAVLEECDAQLNGAASAYPDAAPQQTLLRAQVNELWAQLGVVRAKREALASQGRVDSGNTEWAIVDEANFEELTSILASLQQGLLHLTNTLSADTKALNMVCDGLTGVPLVGIRNR